MRLAHALCLFAEMTRDSWRYSVEHGSPPGRGRYSSPILLRGSEPESLPPVALGGLERGLGSSDADAAQPSSRVLDEDRLQNLLGDNPHSKTSSLHSRQRYASAGRSGRAAGRWTSSISVPEGYLTIVETKLWRNPQARREVVAQIVEEACDDIGAPALLDEAALDEVDRLSAGRPPVGDGIAVKAHQALSRGHKDLYRGTLATPLDVTISPMSSSGPN